MCLGSFRFVVVGRGRGVVGGGVWRRGMMGCVFWFCWIDLGSGWILGCVFLCSVLELRVGGGCVGIVWMCFSCGVFVFCSGWVCGSFDCVVCLFVCLVVWCCWGCWGLVGSLLVVMMVWCYGFVSCLGLFCCL